MSFFYQILFFFLLFISCSKKENFIFFEDKLVIELEKSLKRKTINFQNIKKFSNYTKEFNQQFELLYNNRFFIKKINELIKTNNFSLAQKLLKKKIFHSGKTSLVIYIKKIFDSAQAIKEYKFAYPFDQINDNSRAITLVQKNTKIFKSNLLFQNWLAREKLILKIKIKNENKLILNNLSLYNDLYQTNNNSENIPLLLTSLVDINSDLSQFFFNKSPITLENPLTEKRWLNLHFNNNNIDLIIDLIDSLPSSSLNNILTRIDYQLKSKKYKKVYQLIHQLFEIKLISNKKLATIIQKHISFDIDNSIIFMNTIVEQILNFN